MSNILYESSRGIQPISIKDSMLSKREIFFIDDVNAQSSNELLMQLMYLENEDSSKEITIYINSHGGEVTSGLAVYDYISMMNSMASTFSAEFRVQLPSASVKPPPLFQA